LPNTLRMRFFALSPAEWGGRALVAMRFLPEMVPKISASQRKFSRFGSRHIHVGMHRPRKKVRAGAVRSALQRLLNLLDTPYMMHTVRNSAYWPG